MEKASEELLLEQVKKFKENVSSRNEGEKKTFRQQLADAYQEMVKAFPEVMKKKFPHPNYGSKRTSKTAQLSVPLSFKRYFITLVRSFVKLDGKLM